MAGILDILTGGKDKAASDALKRAEAAFANIATPAAAQLTLPELQKLVEAGIMTPAQAQAALQQGNAYNDIKVDPRSMEAEQSALSQLSDVATKGGMTNQMKAQLADALDKVQTQERGANASILDQMAQRGIPTSLMAPAAMMANAGDEARAANLAGTQAAGQAEQNAINAMMSEGNLAGQIHGQAYNEQANKAAAENAMRQWNAQATNTANLTNAGYQQQANDYNARNKQGISNENTALTNQRTAYNANVPETVFQNQIQKASGQAGVNQAQANQATNSGNQLMGLLGAGVGTAMNAFAPGTGTAATSATRPPPGYNPNMSEMMLPGGAEGGVVTGHANVPGDSEQNDKVHAMLSPGEVVVPRTIAPHPEAVKRFVQHLMYSKEAQPSAPVHPDDVHSVLEALTRRRNSPTTVGSSRG